MKSLHVYTIILFVLAVHTAFSQEELETDQGLNKIRFGEDIQPMRTKPVFRGGFSVAMVIVNFPDNPRTTLEGAKANFKFGPMTIKEYFEEYSQDICWPEAYIAGESDYPKNIYMAPEPRGYYCKFDHWGNPMGYKGKQEGNERASALRRAARSHALTYNLPDGMPTNGGKPHLVCFMYETKLKPLQELEQIVGEAYGERKHPWKKDAMCWEIYRPSIVWGEPLWPNSTPQVLVSGGGGTLCHELGHVIGAPDFYHAPEKNDGLPGDTCLGCAYGPTGPGYCRYIYNAFLNAKHYPTFKESGQYTLAPRSTNPAGDNIVGCFIPSSHPHYVYHLEYVSGEKAPLGNPGQRGLLVHVINLTMNASFLGSPDLCYTYRPDDPWFRSAGNPMSFFGEAHGRTSFNMETNPSSRLPNLLDGGVYFEIVEESDDAVTIDLKIRPISLMRRDYEDSLLPKISLDKVDELLPTSFRAHTTVLFRGEPLLTEYGFCWSTKEKPTVQAEQYFPLYHRDRYNGRALGLMPQTKYYVRAYARSVKGTTYSEKEMVIVTPSLNDEITTVAPLTDDKFSANRHILKYHFKSMSTDSTRSHIGGTAMTALLKLATYYRRAPTLKEPSRKKRKENSKPLDYTRIHTRPSDSKPEFRLEEFKQASGQAMQVANQVEMRKTEFDKKFDPRFITFFDIKASVIPKRPPIEDFTNDNLESVREGLIESLILGHPVMIGQQPTYDPYHHCGLSWVIVDGVNENKQFHVIYPDGHDGKAPELKRNDGWFSLKSLLGKVDKAKVFWGLKPDYGHNYARLKAMPVKHIARTLSADSRSKLDAALISTLADLSIMGKLTKTPMSISKTRETVFLAKADGEGNMTFQSEKNEKQVIYKFGALSNKDHSRLAHVVTLAMPDNADFQAMAGVYFESIGRADLAVKYYKKAGKESTKQLGKLFQ